MGELRTGNLRAPTKASPKGEWWQEKISIGSQNLLFLGMQIRKSLSKAKGLSKEDILDGKGSQLEGVGGVNLSLSADELRMMSDGDPEHGHLTMPDEGRRTSSESDGDLYSFHSATDEHVIHVDLLSDIQQGIRENHGNTDVVLNRVTVPLAEGVTSPTTDGDFKPLALDPSDPQEVGSTLGPDLDKGQVDETPVGTDTAGPDQSAEHRQSEAEERVASGGSQI
nr:formin-2-like [Oncorhynchus nerka]